MLAQTRIGKFLAFSAALAVVVFTSGKASALIMGGEGNDPIQDPGWPKGAAAIFNVKARIAWWEGPPFGGGQWHAECRGDAKALTAVLADFAQLDVKAKRIVLHDGVGRSFWLDKNNDPAKQAAARMDWRFMVWQPASWDRLRNLPVDLNPTDPDNADQGPPAQIDIYTGGNIKWADVTVPKNITIVDNRLESHGFTVADGVVLEGKVIDLATKKPLTASMRLEIHEKQPKGGYRYKKMAETKTDEQGRWFVKKTPAGWHRVIIESEGYAPRIIGHVQVQDQPRWQSFDSGLARAASVVGRVIDESGKPLADVEVRLADVATVFGQRYESPQGYEFKTKADGTFRADQLPMGKAAIWVHKPGYVRPGLGQRITIPHKEVEVEMMKSSKVIVTVDFTDKARPKDYLVRIIPEAGEAVGRWGGSGHIDAKNQITYDNVPPGRYIIWGHPNPTGKGEETESVTIDLKGGKTHEVKLNAR